MRKSILELKRRFKKEDCTFTKICGCFVNADKNIILKLDESFLSLEEEDFFKYLEIAKKTLSGKVNNSLLNLEFSDDNVKTSLMSLKVSKLKEEALLDSFYQNIIDNYDYPESYLILVFHDVYDVITKTTDNLNLDESEEVYEYILCSICPVTLSKPGLSYHEDENTIKSRLRDWVVEAPINGFLYPAFIERSQDIDSLIYYTKDTKDINEEFVEKSLGCIPKKTIKIQQETFKTIVTDLASIDEEEANDIYIQIQDNLNYYMEEQKAISPNLETDSFILSKDNLPEVLADCNIEKENTEKIEEFFEESFKDSLPAVENLIDKKALKLSEQRKKELQLQNQVKTLKTKLENSIPIPDKEYDLILQAKDSIIDQIKSDIIDGQKCLIVPIEDEDKAIINKIEEKEIEN